MANDAANNVRFISAELDADEHRLLCRLATEWGRKPAELVTVAVRRFLQTVDPDSLERPLDLQVYQALAKMHKAGDIETYLRDMALAYQANPTEENAELLTTTAEQCGYTVEELLRWIEEDRLVPLGTMPSKMDVALNFLQSYMQKGQEYPSLDIIEKAAAQGISQGQLNGAKRALGIRSVRRPNCWIWVRD